MSIALSLDHIKRIVLPARRFLWHCHPLRQARPQVPRWRRYRRDHDLVPNERGPWRTTRRNPMPLPNLIPAGGPVRVQNTTFAVDALGRYVCNTWDEATANGGGPFDAIVVGAGMYGAYCAAKIFRRHPGKRVLLLDAGRFLVSEHVQNLARIGRARARLGHSLARQRGVSRARLLHRRKVDLLGWVVSAAHQRRPAGLA